VIFVSSGWDDMTVILCPIGLCGGGEGVKEAGVVLCWYRAGPSRCGRPGGGVGTAQMAACSHSDRRLRFGSGVSRTAGPAREVCLTSR